MAINTAPQPSTCLVLDPDGRGTVLQVTSVHNLDGETLAERLYEAYAMTTENNMELPEEITTETLMAALGEQIANCAEGWHTWANEPTQEAWDTVRPWAERQVRRLFPGLTWRVEADRQFLPPTS
ncbi:hypothetical protein ABZ605_32740 [Streptomyces sp. NPDC012765]|uniref:hypothetical protein n=1 Tax=Streptomyces sp. NPDC012765 TaxID=3155249 RepID=UPI0033E2C2AA